jgi:hypothetical protein
MQRAQLTNFTSLKFWEVVLGLNKIMRLLDLFILPCAYTPELEVSDRRLHFLMMLKSLHPRINPLVRLTTLSFNKIHLILCMEFLFEYGPEPMTRERRLLPSCENVPSQDSPPMDLKLRNTGFPIRIQPLIWS